MAGRVLGKLLAVLLGSSVAVVIFAGLLTGQALIAAGQPAGAVAVLIDGLPALLAAAATGGLLALGFQWRGRDRRRRLLAQVERYLAGLREAPGPNAGVLRGGLSEADLDAVRLAADALAGCYRKALGDVVTVREKLDQLRAILGQPDGNSQAVAVTPTHLVVSSRHRLVARLAPNLNVMAATPPLRQFVGRTPQELLARSFLDVVHPQDVAVVRRALEESLRDGEAHNISFRILLPPASGRQQRGKAPVTMIGTADRERHLQMDVLTCCDETGTPQHLRCHFVDITERVRAEVELQRRTREVSEANDRLRQANADLERLKESYRDLYHHAPVLYFSLDAAGNLVAFNETMVRILGYPRERLLGQSYAILLTPAARAAFQANPGMMQQPGEVETQWVKQDGTVIDVWVGTTTIRDPNGQFIRSRSVARDVSETRRLANALRHKADELARSNKRLLGVNLELEEFTYVVSHDLKEPLRTLESFSNFLAQDYGDQLEGDGKEFIGHLVQASRRLGRLIDDLLTLSRTGRVINTPRAFAWRPVIDTLMSDLRELVGRKQAVVRVEEPLPGVVGDPERVLQLLTNLVSNGLKYNQNARPEVVIGALAAPADRRDDRFVTLYVRDNGIGIDPGYHEQVFRIFRRLHHRDDVEGTGAGLAICKRIVEAHGGRIWIESQVGRGATFLFTLPRQPEDRSIKAERRPEVPRGQVTVLAAG
jgi:PAS domain S-box-containing protein